LKNITLIILLIFSSTLSATAVERTLLGGIVYNLRDSTSTDTLPAEIIMRTIDIAGEDDVLRCDSLIIKGRLHFPDTVRCVLDFHRATLLDELECEKEQIQTAFLSEVIFFVVKFVSKADFRWAEFSEWAIFVRGEFSEEADFGGAQFGSMAEFGNMQFVSEASFYGAQFDSTACFLGTEFQKEAQFGHTQFASKADFLGVRFGWAPKFCDAQFASTADFSLAQFGSAASFPDARFNPTADFGGAQFASEADFGRAQFELTANFRNAQFSSTTDFSNTNFINIFDLRDAVFDSLSSLLIEETNYTELLINWPQIKGKISFVGESDRPVPALDYRNFQDVAHVYIPLIKNFRDLGQFDDEDGCYYEMKTIERRCEKGFGKIMPPILWLTCGYGVRPENTIYSSIFLIFFFAGLYYLQGAIEERKIETSKAVGSASGTINDERSRWERFRDAVYFSVNTFTTVGYGDWVPTTKALIRIPFWIPGIRDCGEFKLIYFRRHDIIIRFRTLAMFEGLFGWLLLALFLITLGRKYIR